MCQTKKPIFPPEDIDWTKVSGPVAIRMTNDYLFRATLQENNSALRGLICSLLHLKQSQMKSVIILNPIELGKTIDEKTFILDVKVLLNNDTVINLEMQIINEANWPERSLLYLCRAFDNLNSGESYINVKPVIQIGLLDFTLFSDMPEFYATYRMINEKNQRIYSDKIRLSVVDLTRIELATNEDKSYEIDRWAAFFKATTWEEIKMLAESNTNIKEASATMYKLSQEEKIRQQCEAREEYYRRENTRRIIREQLDRQNKQLTERNEQLTERNKQLTDQNEQLTDQNEQLTDQNEQLTDRNEQLTDQNEQLTDRNEQLTDQNEQLTDQNEQLTLQLAGKDSVIAQQEARNQRLRQRLIDLGLDPDEN